MTCPCGSGLPLEACCGLYLGPDGVPPPTAEALMRSRYTAYVAGDIDHVVRTQAADDGDVDRAALEKFSRDSEWLGLEIVARERGGEEDDQGTVEFVARYRPKRGGPEQRHHERSRFERRDGAWTFVAGEPVRQPPARRAPTVGRNEPCPCGSGKKFKRCHGA